MGVWSICTPSAEWYSSTATLLETTAEPSSDSNCDNLRCNHTGTCRVQVVGQRAGGQKVVATPKGTPYESSCSNRASSRQTNPSPTDTDPIRCSPRCNQRGNELW